MADTVGKVSNKKSEYFRSLVLATEGTKFLKMQHCNLSTRQNDDTRKENMQEWQRNRASNFI